MGKNLTNVYFPFYLGNCEEFNFYKTEWEKRYNSSCIIFVDKKGNYEDFINQIYAELSNRKITAKHIHLLLIKEIENKEDIDLIRNEINEFENVRKKEEKSTKYIFYLYPFLKIKQDLLEKTLNTIDRPFFIFTDRKKDGTVYSREEWIDHIMDYLHLLFIREEKPEVVIHQEDILPINNYLTFTSEKAEFKKVLTIKRELLLHFKGWLDEKVSRRQANPVMDFLFEDKTKELESKLQNAISFPEHFEKFQSALNSMKYIDENKIKRGEDYFSVYEQIVTNAVKNFEEDDIDKFAEYVEQNYVNFRNSYREFLKNNEKSDFIEWGIKELKGHSLPEIMETLQKTWENIKIEEKREYPNFKIIEKVQGILRTEKKKVEEKRKKLNKVLNFFNKKFLVFFSRVFFIILLLFIFFIINPLVGIFTTFISPVIPAVFFSLILLFLVLFLIFQYVIYELQKSLLEIYKDLSVKLVETFKDLSKEKFERVKRVMFYPFILNFGEICKISVKKTIPHFEELKKNFILTSERIDKIIKDLKELKSYESSLNIEVDWYESLGDGNKESIFYLPWHVYSEENIEFIISPEVKRVFETMPDSQVDYDYDEERLKNSISFYGELKERGRYIFIVKHPAWGEEIKTKDVKTYCSIKDETILGLKILLVLKLDNGGQNGY